MPHGIIGRSMLSSAWLLRPSKAGQTIEVWVLESTDADYKSVERHLNAKYNTIGNGWATRLG